MTRAASGRRFPQERHGIDLESTEETDMIPFRLTPALLAALLLVPEALALDLTEVPYLSRH